ncbi:MAG: hypothetical protein A2293_11145 [Elusimicrobia bacterium RIFOXYB2_FULL_49_7]|nr:MAG: hypothetical protein A2293_11145 [Elusimicrobia bacterium RIFOXYB2_FULL_49_7]
MFKRNAFILACALLISTIWGDEPRPIRSIAVVDLEASGMELGEAKTLSDALRTKIIDFGRFTVLERSKMDVILKEQGFQQSGACTNEACAVEMGQLLGVDAMVIGSVGRVGKTYSLTVRLLDLQTGKILHSASQYYKGEIDGLLTETVDDVAEKICAVDDKGESTAQRKQVESAPVTTASSPTPAPAVQKKSHVFLYSTLGIVAVAGGAGAFLFLNKKTEDGGTPETPSAERPDFPSHPFTSGGK